MDFSPLTDWPISPSMVQRPDTFDLESENFLGHFSTFGSELSNLLAELTVFQQEMIALKDNAAASAGLAANELNNCKDEVALAAGHATAAESASNATPYNTEKVGGYAVGYVAYSETSGFSYRCIQIQAQGSVQALTDTAYWTRLGGLGELAEDTTPQLGGDLDMSGHDIQTVTPTEMARVHGVTSNIQTQINGKLSNDDNSVTLAKMAHGTDGNLITYDASGAPAYVATGANDQVLKSNGAGAAPSFQDAGGAGMTLLQVVTASYSSTIDIEGNFDSTYDNYVIMASNVVFSTNQSNMECTLKIGGSYHTSGYTYHYHASNSVGDTYVAANSDSTSQIILSDLSGSATAADWNCRMHISGPSKTTKNHNIRWTGSQTNSDERSQFVDGVGNYYLGTGALTGVRIKPAGGMLNSGTFSLYGYKKAV